MLTTVTTRRPNGLPQDYTYECPRIETAFATLNATYASRRIYLSQLELIPLLPPEKYITSDLLRYSYSEAPEPPPPAPPPPPPPYPPPPPAQVVLCANNCPKAPKFASDSYCDDGGPDATFDNCELGTDCTLLGSNAVRPSHVSMLISMPIPMSICFIRWLLSRHGLRTARAHGDGAGRAASATNALSAAFGSAHAANRSQVGAAQSVSTR